MNTRMTAKITTMLVLLITYTITHSSSGSGNAGSISSSSPYLCSQPPVVAPSAGSGSACMLCGTGSGSGAGAGAGAGAGDDSGAGAGAGDSNDGSGAGAGDSDDDSGAGDGNANSGDGRVIFAQGAVTGAGIPSQSVIRVPFVSPFSVPNVSGNVDPDTFADPARQIFAQGSVGGPISVQSIAKVPLINGR